MPLPGRERLSPIPTEVFVQAEKLIETSGLPPRLMLGKLMNLNPHLGDSVATDLEHPGASKYFIEEGLLPELLSRELARSISSASPTIMTEPEQTEPGIPMPRILRTTTNKRGHSLPPEARAS